MLRSKEKFTIRRDRMASQLRFAQSVASAEVKAGVLSASVSEKRI